MKVFIDTEFTNFHHPELISLGAVAETGEEFYVEIFGADQFRSSEFVKEVVVPLLKRGEYTKSTAEAAARFYVWLEEQGNDVQLTSDSSYDKELALRLLEKFPENVKEYVSIYAELSRAALAKAQLSAAPDPTWFYKKAEDLYHLGIAEYHLQERVPAHVAINDARAMQRGWKAATEWLNQYY